MAEFVDATPIPGDTISKRWFTPAVDFMPCSAARVSFGNEDKTGQDVEKDKKLMQYLAEHQHMTPFQHQFATFLVECPLFVAREWMRHRTQSYNEISRRYTSDDVEFWVPSVLRGQSKSNRQASDGVCDNQSELRELIICQYEIAAKAYQALLDQGVAREQARTVLPQGMITRFYASADLRNWADWYKLRIDDSAQEEIRQCAKRVGDKLTELWPNSWGALVRA
jgi:thymidylate synthase (FAD)